MNLCMDCINKIEVPGDCHIRCAIPPKNFGEIGGGGDERYDKAKEAAIKHKAVIRCIWPGSGMFPICFDSNTIFGCCNREPKAVCACGKELESEQDISSNVCSECR